MYDDQSYLAHYGVLGMKWGTRRGIPNAMRRSKEARKGADAIRKVGGAYADSMNKKQSNIQKRADKKISKAKRGEKLIRTLTEKYAGAMDKKAERIDKQIAERIKQVEEKKKKNSSWLKKQTNEWKQAFEEASIKADRRRKGATATVEKYGGKGR